MSKKLSDLVSDLTERVARLEDAVPTPVSAVVDSRVPVATEGRVGYSGTGPWEDQSVAWQMERHWDDVVDQAPEQAHRVLSALANPTRLRIVGVLVAGAASTADLSERVEVGTTGQLFHHLKDLLAAGVVYQPQRGVYALRPQHVVPLLAVLSAAVDLSNVTESNLQ
jgi:DNA-binding transcriptional ArsR family regulator